MSDLYSKITELCEATGITGYRLAKDAGFQPSQMTGRTEVWELAEYFDVTEEFMRKAVCWYTQGSHAVEQYFQS